ncbi:MAG TPA: AAA family ATPase [Candidatus Limnocylindria bacterium]|nr:AAA family ATPase [Candidatus Limnocylindria bacterium]
MTSTGPSTGSITAKPSARGSRRIVSVLFIDVVDSTVLADALDPETFRALMGRYFEEAERIIVHHGGFVEKFIGDAVMAVFGVPRMHEDDALRAVTAAVDVRDRLLAMRDEFERSWGTSIAIRAGVETGEAMAQLHGPSELYVTGPAVHTAARLQQTASPNDVLIGGAAHEFVRDAVQVTAIGELELKGKQAPVSSWRVEGIIRGAAGRTRRLDAPMVDREAELDRLLGAFDRASASGGQIVTVIGPAGAGKSRLAKELTSRIGERATVLSGRCLPYGDGITFWPVLEMLRDVADISDSDSPAESAAKLGARLREVDEGQLIQSRLAGLLGSGTAQPAIQEMFWAIRRLLEHSASERPVVVVFDDIQWGQPTFLDLLEYLADWTRAAPVLLVCMARPEMLDARPGWGSAKPNAELMWLQPLSSDDSRQLVEQIIGPGKVRPDAVARIIGLGEGNPLFVEETLRMLMDTGDLRLVQGEWQLRARMSELSIPTTIHALIAARLDRLDSEEAYVLEAASVVGKVFGWGAVHALTDEAVHDAIGAHLQSLMRKQLIRPRHGERDDEDTFEFTHAVTRDAAYGRIAKSDRARLHARFATWLQEERRDRVGEFEEIIGYHLEQAHATLLELGPPSARTEELAQRAFEPLGRAGQRAFARGDMPAAARLLSRATGLLPAGNQERGRLLPQLAFALMETGDFERLQAVVGEASAAAEAGDRAMQAHATILQLWIRLFTDPVGWADAAQKEATRTVAAFEELGDERGLARASSLLGLVNMMKGNFAEAERAWEQASSHARHAGDQRDEMESMSWVPLTVWAGPTPTDEGLLRTEELLRRSDGDKKAMSSALMARGAFEAGIGRFDEARQSMRRARELLDEIALTVWRAGPYTQLAGWVETLANDSQAAERELRWGFEKLSEIGEMSWFSTVAGILGEAVLANGRPDEAHQLAEASRDAAAPDDVYSQVLWRTVASKVLARNGTADDAERLAREAVEIVSPTDFLHLRWHALLSLAHVLSDLGRPAEATEYASRAAELAARKGCLVAERRASETAELLRKM